MMMVEHSSVNDDGSEWLMMVKHAQIVIDKVDHGRIMVSDDNDE